MNCDAYSAAEILDGRALLAAAIGEVTSELRIANTPAAAHRDDPDVYPIQLGNLDQFGRAMTSLGDLDGDGVLDMAVSAYGDDDGGVNRGAVYVLFMNPDGTVKAEQKISNSEGGFTAALEDNDSFGWSVANLGDLDGDSRIELAVGAFGDDDGGSGRGAVYLLDLNTNGIVHSYQKISSTTGGFSATLADADGFGRSVARLGDLDGDGVTDLAVGAAHDDDGGVNRGAVYVLFMNPDGTVKGEQKISNTEGGFTAALEDYDNFGWSVSSLGDLDADGVLDLAVGTRLDDDGGTDRGAVYALFLNADGTVKSQQKISSTAGNFAGPLDDGDQFGISLANMGDFNGDGTADLAVGATGDDDGGVINGAVYILFLNPDGTVLDQQKISDTAPPYRGGGFGTSVANLGDLDGDGVIDLGIGAQSQSGAALFSGMAYVVFLNADGTEKSYKAIGDIEAPFDLGQTFFLNSQPGAMHTIYLDFNGHTTTGTSWNSQFTGGAPIVTPAYDIDGDASAFSDVELAFIQRIWQRVAEDFMPFNVNVTTQDPGIEALRKTGSQNNPDSQWGNRIVIGGSNSWYDSGAGGVAKIGSFNWSTDTPAFVFSSNVSSANGVAETISHETGHTLGLTHDGRTSPAEEYYGGHGTGATSWGPIMGFTSKELTQWSRGEYLNANNTQDDLAIITTNNGFGYRADDYGNSTAAATELIVSSSTFSTSGIIERNTDTDWFSFTTVTGDVSISIDPAERGPNLDILAALYDASNVLIATSNPLDSLNALFQVTLTAGQYYVSVTGTGKGDPLVDGYTDYGSLGQYFVSGSIAAVPGDFLSISATDAVKPEGNASSTAYTFTVTRSGDVSGATTIDYIVTAGGTNPASANDFPGGIFPTGTINFVANATEQVVTVYVNGDVDFEQAESFTVTLVNATGLTHIVTGSATGSIVNDDFPPTKFFVADDGTADQTFEYDASGGLIESYNLGSGNSAPRGAASTAAGNRVWVVDSNRKVYVYDASGTLLGSWTAGTLASNATVEGIATNGTDVWIVDARSDKVYRYAGAATRLSGSQNATSNFSLKSGNTSPKDIVTDGVSLWVVNDSTTDKVFKYTTAGALQGSWTIDAANSKPTGLTIVPSNVSTIWIVDSGTDRIYQYDNVATRTSGSQTSSTSYALAAGNTNPQGIADPPAPTDLNTTQLLVPGDTDSQTTVFRPRSFARSVRSPLRTARSGESLDHESLSGELGVSSRLDNLEVRLSRAPGFSKKTVNGRRSADIPALGDQITAPTSPDISRAPELDHLFADWSTDPLQLL